MRQAVKGVRRMKYKTMLAVVCVSMLVLAACAPQETVVPTTITEPTMAATEPATTEPSTTETAASPEATSTGAAETPTAGVPVTGAVTISVSESADYGPILVNSEGMSLYLFMADTQDSGSSTCGDDDGCATDWPPLTCTAAGAENDNTNANANANDNANANANANTNANTNTAPDAMADCSPEAMAGEGVDSTLLGTITREDGSTQVTYNGWPLYLFHEDLAAGDTNGQGLDEFGGLWYLVSPTGEAVIQ
jgi:predicted lipoprotein with Yx(FWY)xxD motif